MSKPYKTIGNVLWEEARIIWRPNLRHETCMGVWRPYSFRYATQDGREYAAQRRGPDDIQAYKVWGSDQTDWMNQQEVKAGRSGNIVLGCDITKGIVWLGEMETTPGGKPMWVTQTMGKLPCKIGMNRQEVGTLLSFTTWRFTGVTDATDANNHARNMQTLECLYEGDVDTEDVPL
jgi:hypothetical protein